MSIKRCTADREFSLYIRERDNWTCVRCKRKHHEKSKGLHCSHFFNRWRESTRFDPDNCDALCYPCHRLWGGDGRKTYEAFKRVQLGETRFALLEDRARNTLVKKDRRLALITVRALRAQLKGGV